MGNILHWPIKYMQIKSRAVFEQHRDDSSISFFFLNDLDGLGTIAAMVTFYNIKSCLTGVHSLRFRKVVELDLLDLTLFSHCHL